ncbi:hypothetical protein BDV96DRAFT_605328 [Lophiotrema nucula]|uniref:Uncharacterized protein n=1 Tax=Lophiotrema nucula TaxID=690887 RepID=A0A6A5YS36_9PLEO|nr:hypothetical protein BDV96DRAFT_605328 [Lophiotrema nucula]
MAICYDASGNPESSSDLPCSQDGSPAQCCWITDGCADNGLCVTNDSATDLTPYFINGCTDPNWADGSVSTCLTACLNSLHAPRTGDCETPRDSAVFVLGNDVVIDRNLDDVDNERSHFIHVRYNDLRISKLANISVGIIIYGEQQQ